MERMCKGISVKTGKWVYGYYMKATCHWHNRGVHTDWILSGAIQNGGFFNVIKRFAVVDGTVCRCSGVKDLYDNYIFEGDILFNDVLDETYIVKFYDGKFVALLDGNVEFDLDEVADYTEIRGNEHDK